MSTIETSQVTTDPLKCEHHQALWPQVTMPVDNSLPVEINVVSSTQRPPTSRDGGADREEPP
jgi:hypothetical protein